IPFKINVKFEFKYFSDKLGFMIITYHGADFFKVSFGDTTIAINPISKDSKIKSTKFGSDITLVSVNSPEHNGLDVTSRGDKEPFAITGPGEYEVSGVFIKGFLSTSLYGGSEKINTIYTVNLENMNLGFLGALGDEKLSPEAKEALDGVDVLFVPIGGEGVLDPAIAHKIAVQFSPKIIIPAHFGEVGDKNALKVFLKEAGEEGVKPVDKLTIKKKDLDGKEGEVVVLESI
ncbi:MAG TPA: MBL fold metallo-hydrolase, partial [Parcubacteria group bacterium]|nr:MBL fold metallo-hydrolase [Parcubacteria group bacterium]